MRIAKIVLDSGIELTREDAESPVVALLGDTKYIVPRGGASFICSTLHLPLKDNEAPLNVALSAFSKGTGKSKPRLTPADKVAKAQEALDAAIAKAAAAAAKGD